MKHFRIGLIGLGSMALEHLKYLNKVANISFSAICEVQENALTASGERLGISPEKRYTDFRQLILDKDVDAVISITPNWMHADFMKKARYST